VYRVSHNQKHLADEFMANPFGRASPELQRVLMVFRGEPLEGKPVLICTGRSRSGRSRSTAASAASRRS
jgi:hypothetical protein